MAALDEAATRFLTGLGNPYQKIGMDQDGRVATAGAGQSGLKFIEVRLENPYFSKLYPMRLIQALL